LIRAFGRPDFDRDNALDTPTATSRLSPLRAALFNDTSHDRHFGCDLVVAEVDRRLAQVGVKPVWRHYVEDDWRTSPEIVSSTLDVDVVVVNGEGTIHDCATWPRGARLCRVGLYAKRDLRVPSFLINATIHAIDDKAAQLLRSFNRIFVRDSASQNELRGFGIDSTVVPDITLSADLPKAEGRSGYCYSGNVKKDSGAQLAARGKSENMPFVCVKKEEYGDAPFAPGPLDYARQLSSYELMLTGRFHVVTFCLATETPFVAVESNTPKISSLLHDIFGSAERVISDEEIASVDLSRFARWSDSEISKLRTFRAAAKESVDRMFAEIGAVAPGQMKRRAAPDFQIVFNG